ncbi:glycine cleavage system aminomethyltransferase GcvT [Microcella sp.]|uniref:glycine cleavage system aminomethyltransferase GcvT n=1 Tax=Microcella sp. TaxID=1913979 RepID=UPI003918D3F7
MTESVTPPPQTSPLHGEHEALGASFTDFGGWLMPVRYTSDLAEHHAVRTAAGLFDISHMAEIAVSGADAGAYLDEALAGRLSTLPLMKAKYSLLLAENGGIVDDLIVYRTGEAEWLVVANAGNRGAVVEALHARRGAHEVELVDLTERTALIALQGPAAQRILERVDGLTTTDELSGTTTLDTLRYYAAMGMAWRGGAVLVARTGYTGEDGFELYVDVEHAAELWRAILAEGASDGLVPCGLAARDTLRLEAGMPLYGHEIGRETLPVQAGLGRVVVTDKPHFVGKAAVEQGPAPDAPVLVGLVGEGRRAARADYVVVDGDREVGVVTSGALSPTLGVPIAMAHVHPDVAAHGTALAVDVRGTRIPFFVVPLPFYQREA